MSVPVAPVIHIGGWPGAGKRTVGRIVARRLGGRLIDNHLMLDAAHAIHDRGTRAFGTLRGEVRDVIFQHARQLPLEVALVLTDALADEPAALPLFQPTVDLAAARGAPLRVFVLDLDPQENRRRLTDPARGGYGKLMDPDILASLRAHETLFCPDGAITLDVTDLSPEAAAEAILSRLEAP